MKYPSSIQKLIDLLSTLPTVGPKTAERYAFYLIRQNSQKIEEFATAFSELKRSIKICHNCLQIAETNPCPICADPERDKLSICVVSDTRDLIAIESTKQFRGTYLVLGGLLSAIDGIKPEHINIRKLVDRIKTDRVREVILALNPSMEGETTSMYIAKLLKDTKIKVTRLARGLPMGAELEYADEMTLSNAIKFRNTL